jgi:hypothetical protein
MWSCLRFALEEGGGDMSRKTDIRERLKTGLANSGRAAGAGVLYDRYDEESGYRPGPADRGPVKLPSDSLTEEEIAALSGPVKVYKSNLIKKGE